MIHTFDVKSFWRGRLSSSGTVSCSGFEATFSAPRELKGAGCGTNPEELLLSASATCYLITLAAMFERQKIPVIAMKMISRITVEAGQRFAIKSIRHRPMVTLGKETGAQMIEGVLELIHSAESVCMVANALRGNIELETIPEIQMEE